MLPNDAVHPAFELEVVERQLRLDARAERTKRVEHLAVDEVLRFQELRDIDHVPGRHVIDAGVAEDVLMRTADRYVLGQLADHHRHLTLMANHGYAARQLD